jgi:hypothetical protein
VLGARCEVDGAAANRLFWLAVGITLLPLIASAVHVLSGSEVANLGDAAGIELRTRDVGHHSVLLGLWSRSNWNHPGPALFYLLALPYRLTGSRPSGLQLGALGINGAAVLGMAVVGRRRGGLVLSLLILFGCGVLLHALGPQFLSDSWNPSTPVLAFGALVLLCWSMICGDVWALPIGAAVTTFCVQTHVGYVPLALPLFLGAAGWLAVRVGRSVRRQLLDPRQRRIVARACILTAAVVGVMWLPPALDQVLHTPGNMVRIGRYFAHPGAAVTTVGEGFRVVGEQFAWRPTWVIGDDKVTSALEPALLHSSPAPLLLVPLVLAGFALWRRRSFEPAALVGTVLIAVVLGMLAVYRTVVPVFAYRLKWTWVLGMLGAVTTVWSGWQLVAPRYRITQQRRQMLVVMPLAVGTLLTLSLVNVSAALRATPQWKAPSAVLDKLLPATVATLPRKEGDVIVRTRDLQSIMYQGVMLALERRGLPARTEDPTGIVGNGADHRVHRRGPVRAILTVATSSGVGRTFAQSNERLIAYWGSVSRQDRIAIARKRAVLLAQKPGTRSQREAFIELADVSKHLNGPEVAIFMVRPGTRSSAAPQP